MTPTAVHFTSVRYDFGADYTISRMAIDGNDFGVVVEDLDRGLDSAMPLAELQRLKVHGRTAIPIGEYEIGVRFSPKHGRNVLYLKAVPDFNYIEVHTGNSAADTDGCLCVGLRVAATPGHIDRSQVAVDWLEAHYLAGIEHGSIAARITVSRDPAAWAARLAS